MQKQNWSERLANVAENVSADTAFLYKHIPSGKNLQLFNAEVNQSYAPLTLSALDGVVHEILRSHKPISGKSQEFGKAFSPFQSRYLLASPLKTKQKTLGMLVLEKKT